MYGKTTVLHSISFSAESGKVTALLGENGSGKSTAIKTIADVM
ncbi:MAG: ATP-binding cassette domain-containing protein, partial [Methanocorpusculum sp.]|nr:ATP-binding cassette domain-containing protein [Methanocorpusculum sp.]